MNPHFFTAPFYFAFIGFRVQGSGFKVQGRGVRWRLRRLFLEDGILVSQPSPRGEGAPKGRIGHWRYEREWGKRRSVSFMKATEASYTCGEAATFIPHLRKAFIPNEGAARP